MPLFLSDTLITSLYLGTSPVSRAYLGNMQVWPAIPQTFSSLFAHDSPPPGGITEANEVGTYALGVVVRPDEPGSFTSIWFYVGTAGLGAVPAKAHIYRYVAINTVPDGEDSYITEDFILPDTIGWQEIILPTPCTAAAGTRYVISISFPSTGAYYTAQPGVFDSDVVSGALTAESRATVGNGRYSDMDEYDDLRRQYPMRNWDSSSYSIDVTFVTNGV